MAGNIKGIIVEIGGDTSGLQKALSKVNSTTSSLSKELKGVNSLLKLDPSNTELVAQKQVLLSKNIEETGEKLELLKDIQKQADNAMANGTKISEENYRNLQREIANTEIKLNGLTDELKQFNAQNSNWTKAGKKVEEYGKKIEKVSEKINDIGNKTSVVSAGVVAGGTALANSAMSLEDAVAKYVSTTNTAEEETEKYKQVLEDINKNNYGDGYEDIANSMSQVKMQLKDINEQDLQNITEKAIALRDLFGYDVSESIRAVKAMMDNLNVTADEAFNLIAEGKKQGLDFSNELLDNINEYSVQFGKLGLSAEDMFNIFKVGADNGAFNLDKIGDAIKEFSIRAIDGSNTTIDGFKRIGLNANKMAKKFANGGEEAKQAFIEVVNRLGSMDNKVSQSIAGVDLFGTMWEDLGPTVITSFSKMDNGISKSSDSMQKSIDQLYNTTKKKAETQLKRLQTLGADFGEEMLPVLEDLIDMAENFVDKLEGMSDTEKENIIKIGLMVAAAGPLVKILGTAGKVIGTTTKGMGLFSQAIAVATNKTTSNITSVNNLAKVISGLTSPVGIAALSIAGSIGMITAATNAMTKNTKESFENIGTSATNFITGIESAKSHLDSFNSTLFASSEEQKKLEEDMQEVQNGITEICKTASDERRDYTQKEINQLNEYFTKLRDLKDRELEIQQNISNAIVQQAEQNAQSFQGSLEEYKINSQEWINTAQQQAEKEISLINERTTQEIALLQQRYGDKATLENEEYANEYNKAIEQKEKLIAQANDQVSKVNAAYANGYLERSKQNESWYNTLNKYNLKIEDENSRHNRMLEYFESENLKNFAGKHKLKDEEMRDHSSNMKNIWEQMYKDMDESQEEQLGTWLAMVAQTELYGGEIDEETQKIVDSIINSYDSMPDDTKKVIAETMNGMLKGMENKEPTLFAKASNIANGILSRLKKTFDIHSPSKETKKIFKNVIKGAEVGIDEETNSLYKEIDSLSEGLLNKLRSFSFKENSLDTLNGNIIEKSKTIFTTPQIVFNVQELDEDRLEQCFNYINRKFGSRY